jgi:hypothetical protein
MISLFNIQDRDVHGGVAAADFLINHRGSGASAADFFKIHRGSIFFRGH